MPEDWMIVNEQGYVIFQDDKYPEYAAISLAQMQFEEDSWLEDQKNLHRLIDVRGYMWT
jgi:hypothetical protein